MTGIVINNNSYDISEIDYSSTGGKVAYSVYGEDIPVIVSNKFKQPVFTMSDTGFTGIECTKNGFTIFADTSFYSRGVGFAFDGNITPNGEDTYYATNVWHSDFGQPHYIGFRYNKQLKVNKLTIYNGTINCIPVNYKLQYKVNDEYVDVVTGTNTELTDFRPWNIEVSGNYVSDDWRLYITSSRGIDSSYVTILEIEIDADIVE